MEHSLRVQLFVLVVKLQTFSIAFPFRLLLYCQKVDLQLFTFSYFSVMATMHLFDEFEAVRVVVYLYTLQSEASNVASFVLPNESFISGHVLKKSPGVSWLSSLLRRNTQQFKILHSFS